MACAAMMKRAKHFWPLKLSILNYVNSAYLDTNEKHFQNNDLDAYSDEENKEEEGESDLQSLLKIVEILNEDFELYLSN